MGTNLSIRQDLPTGTVTFLFTDIEGSTRLVSQVGDRSWGMILNRHHQLIRSALEENDGIEVATEGDSFFAVFTDPVSAVMAALAIQEAMATEEWGLDGGVRVRIGMHTGTAHLGGDNYVGVDLHRGARIAASAHGGQIILSAATAEAIDSRVPAEPQISLLGKFRLADLQQAETLHQLDPPGRRNEFPPPRGARTLSRLPTPLTEFVGRDRELTTVQTLLAEYRLVTLTGPGGTGKTRLAIETARKSQADFDDGATFVGLAQLREPELVAGTILDALGLQTTAKDPEMHLRSYLEERTLLLILDNFEQLQTAAALVGRLLDLAPGVKFLVTSRSPLRIAGEREYPVPPLPVPEVGIIDADRAQGYEAVRLFAARAAAVRPGFHLDAENAQAVAAIATRLDGLPLAIELAASRMRSLTPQLILERLENRLLSTTAPDLPARQQTIVDAIGWSYDLLPEPNRRLFEHCSVFASSFDLAATELVCSGLGTDVLDGLSDLVENSLLLQQATSGALRFRMLTVIKEYGFAALVSRGEDREALESMARHYLSIAEAAEPEILTSRRGMWLERLSDEHDNIRASLEFAINRGDASTALRFVAAMWRFWQMRGHITEGLQRAKEALALEGGEDGERAQALIGLGGLMYWAGAWTETLEPYSRAVGLLRKQGESVALAEALYNQAFPVAFGGDVDQARDILDESLRLSLHLEHALGVGRAYWGLGDVSAYARDYQGAYEYAAQAASVLATLDAPYDLGWSYFMQGFALQRMGRWREASDEMLRSLELFADPVDLSALTLIFEALAAIALELGRDFDATRLAGAARRLKMETGANIGDVPMNQDPHLTEYLESGDEAAATGLLEGESLSLDEALHLARRQGISG